MPVLGSPVNTVNMGYSCSKSGGVGFVYDFAVRFGIDGPDSSALDGPGARLEIVARRGGCQSSARS